MSPTKSAIKQKGGRGMSDRASIAVGAVLALTIVANGIRLIRTAEAVHRWRKLTAAGSTAEVRCRRLREGEQTTKRAEPSTASRRDTCPVAATIGSALKNAASARWQKDPRLSRDSYTKLSRSGRVSTSSTIGRSRCPASSPRPQRQGDCPKSGVTDLA